MTNPLTTADPNLIEELFSRDPLSLTEEELDENVRLLVIAFRSERETWEREKATAKLTGKKLSGQSTKKLQKEEALKRIKEMDTKISLADIMGKKP